MAEPATIVAIVKLVQKTASVIKEVTDYIQEVRQAPEIITRITAQVSTWNQQLDSLHTLLEEGRLQGNVEALLQPQGVMGEAQECLDRLKRIIAEAPRPPQGSGRQFQEFFKRAIWTATSKDEVNDLLHRLGKYGEAIHLALQTSTSFGVSDLLQETRAIQRAQISAQEQQDILAWLEPRFPKDSDPETLQNIKFSLQEEYTCDWMRKSAWWRDWLAGGPSDPFGCQRFLWIHGLPGSGKTILASYLIDQIGRHCTSKGYSYYYCHHDHNRDETLPLLQWVVRDLAIQLNRCIPGGYIPDVLYNVWQCHRSGLTADNLLRCLEALVREFTDNGHAKRVYIVIDGVDESKTPRGRLLEVLTAIGTKTEFKSVSLLFTSRDYPDIRKAIETLLRPAQTSRQPTSILSGHNYGRPPWGRNDCPTPPPTFGMDLDDPVAFSVNMRQGFVRTPSPTKQKRAASGYQGDAQLSPTKKGKISPGGSHIVGGPQHNRDDGLGPDPSELPCSILSMSNNFVKQAIEIFIQKQLNKSERFAGWPRPEFIEKLKTQLAAKAGGIFRTVACHLDMIDRLDLTDEPAILKEIEDMPDMIFDMYEKIIVDGVCGPESGDKNRHNREFARAALALICSDTSEIPDAGVLVEAARLHVPQSIAQDYNFKKLERLLGCLAKVTRLKRRTGSLYRQEDDGGSLLHLQRFSLAHYTVKEYLYHEKTTKGPARAFALSSEKNRILELTVVFYGLRNYAMSGLSRRTPTRFDEYCLRMTEQALSDQPSIVVKEEDIWTAVWPCLEWNAAHQNAIRNKLTREAFPSWARIAAAFEDGCAPEHKETCVVVSLMLLRWHLLAQVYLGTLTGEEKENIWNDTFSLRESDCQTVLQMSVSRRSKQFLDVFVKAGAMFLDEPDILFRALEDPYHSDDGSTTRWFLKALLDHGADPNPPGYKFTPLQLAVRYLEPVWINRLLCCGAKPDAVGDPSGINPPGCTSDRSWHKKSPMEICTDPNLKPDWGQSGSNDEETRNSRRRAKQLLRQFQANSVVEDGTKEPEAGGSKPQSPKEKRMEIVEISDNE